MIKTKQPIWLKRSEKSWSLKSRELYLEENITDMLEDYEEIIYDDVGFLSS